jgi:hypothetical protein
MVMVAWVLFVLAHASLTLKSKVTTRARPHTVLLVTTLETHVRLLHASTALAPPRLATNEET